jgi:hypothetical protein
VVPLIIAVILGPRAELQARRALQLSGGELSGLWNTPLTKFIYLVIAIVLLWPLIGRFVLRGRHPLEEAAEQAGVPMEDLEGHYQPMPEQPVPETEPRSRVPEAEPPPTDRDGDGRARP